jgi:hypothetical protein
MMDELLSLNLLTATMLGVRSIGLAGKMVSYCKANKRLGE